MNARTSRETTGAAAATTTDATTVTNTTDPATAHSDAGALPDKNIPGFTNLLSAELRRLMNLRSTWVFAIFIAGFVAAPPVLLWLTLPGAKESLDLKMSLLGTDFALFTAMVFAAAGSASEIANRRIAFPYLAFPGRWAAHLARVLVQLLIALVSALAGAAVGLGFVAATGALDASGDVPYTAIIGGYILWTVIASAVGMLIPNTATAVAMPLVWILAVEQTLSVIPTEWASTIVKFLPWINTRQLIGAMDAGYTATHAWTVILVWFALLVGAGFVVACRRDVK